MLPASWQRKRRRKSSLTQCFLDWTHLGLSLIRSREGSYTVCVCVCVHPQNNRCGRHTASLTHSVSSHSRQTVTFMFLTHCGHFVQRHQSQSKKTLIADFKLFFSRVRTWKHKFILTHCFGSKSVLISSSSSDEQKSSVEPSSCFNYTIDWRQPAAVSLCSLSFSLSFSFFFCSHPRLLAVHPGQRVGLLHRAVTWVVQALHRLVLPHHQAVHHPEHDGLQGEPEVRRGGGGGVSNCESTLCTVSNEMWRVTLTLTMKGTMSITSTSSSWGLAM